MTNRVICLLVADGPYEVTDYTGKVWKFEWPYYGGPVALHTQTGDPLKRQPGPKSAFWDVVEAWGRSHKK